MSDFGTPTPEQLEKINKLSKRTLSAEEVFAFSGKSAGDMMIPNRFTRLSKELLQTMADDAQKGVSFMYNHNWSGYQGLQGVPYGKVFDGEIKASAETDETVGLHLSKYIVRDDEVVEGMSANSLIKKIESGVLSDTSISFSTDTMVCSICGMNYFGGECSHLRGRSYDMADGTKKLCTVTAMPPSIIIPYNNNALYEESVVWDGAYPGAMVSQAKEGDVVELPTGNFAILGDKEELPDNTTFINRYCKGNIITMVKKSEHKKIYGLGDIEDKKGEKAVNKKALKALEALGITYKEGETKIDEELFNQIGEKWDGAVETIKASVEPLKPAEGEPLKLTDEFIGIPVKEVKEKLGAEITADNLLSLAKEGKEYHKSLSEEAIAMGVRAMGNDFPKETWEKSFANMETKSIKDIMKTWELQAESAIPAGRHSDPQAGADNRAASLPDEAFKC